MMLDGKLIWALECNFWHLGAGLERSFCVGIAGKRTSLYNPIDRESIRKEAIILGEAFSGSVIN